MFFLHINGESNIFWNDAFAEYDPKGFLSLTTILLNYV